MTQHSVRHATIVIERRFDASPAHVFAAWADPEARLAWGNPGGDWSITLDRFEWKPGGMEITRFGPQGGPEFLSKSILYDIVDDRRIVSAGTMTSQGKLLFAGMMTVELSEEGTGCRLKMTEQGAFLDGHDLPENHEAGWTGMLGKLGEFLNRTAAH